MDLLLEVWREACRHIEIGEFVARIAPPIARVLPFQSLFLRRIELERLRIETVASAAADLKNLPARTRTECTAHEIDEVLRWSLGSETLAGEAKTHPLLRQLAPPEI